MKFDASQKAAIAVRSNVVVRAGAGAGKTSVLVERFVRLVANDRIPVDQILTLTFTRKAAAEMHERIYQALAEHAKHSGHDNQFVAAQLERFESAVISTLDSFCGSVARSGCTAFGIAPTFTVDETKLSRFADDLALRFLLGREREARTLVRLNRFGPLWHDGFASLARDHFLVSRELDLRQMAASQWDHLTDEIIRLSEMLRTAVSAIVALNGEAAKCVATAQAVLGSMEVSALFDGGISAALSGTSAHGVDESGIARISEILGALPSFGRIKKNCGSSRNPEVEEFKTHVDTLRFSADGLHELLHSLLSWPEVLQAVELASEFQSMVTGEKRRTGVLSYHDVAVLAISVLETNLELRRHYKNRFRAIMIDEFQDNNNEQKQLLYLLAEHPNREERGVPSARELDPAKLFFVGDEKQSIYRFRGADVSVFRRLSDDLGGEQSAITLASNYRSEPGLIRFFNAFFSRVFSNPDPAYEARFAALDPRDAVPDLTPTVQLWRLTGRGSDTSLMENDEAEAFHIARFIRESVDNGSLAVADESRPGSTRTATYSDFAILMRSTGNQMRVERTLRLMGVPYVAQTSRSLFLEAPMNDIYNPLQLALFPQDRVALAGFLRSPLVGMTDAGMVRILGDGCDLFEPVTGLDPEDQIRYAAAARRIEELRLLADSSRLTDVVHHIWYHWGYRYHLLRRDDHITYLEHYEYIYELARLHEDRGLADFLRTVRSHMGRIDRMEDLDIVRDQTGGVQIMTIHKAKGLEFPVVILANTGNRGRTDAVSDAPFYRSDQHGLVFNVSASNPASPRDSPVNFVYRAERDLAREQDVAELRRLLYVAATRARAHLIFSGFPRGNDSSMMTMLVPPFLAAEQELQRSSDLSISTLELSPVPVSDRVLRQKQGGSRDITDLAAAYSRAAADGLVRSRSFPRRTFSVTELNAAAANADAARPLRATAAVAIEAPPGRELTIDTPAADGLADAFGTFAHYCLERIGTERSDAASLRRASALPAFVRPPLEGGTLKRFLDEGVELAQSFLGSDLWTHAANAASREFELPFLLKLPSGPDGAVLVRGKIDLLIEYEDRVIVVDFKTDRVLSPGDYAVQMALYRRAAGSIYGRSAQSVLWHLRSGAAVPADVSADVPVDEDLLAALVGLVRDSERQPDRRNIQVVDSGTTGLY